MLSLSERLKEIDKKIASKEREAKAVPEPKVIVYENPTTRDTMQSANWQSVFFRADEA